MSVEHNPLKQYFRRPGIYLKLPSKGLTYGPEVISIPETGEIPIFPMTAIDEITSKTPDALYNGSAVVDIIKSCVPCIHDAWKIVSTDLDAILVAIKIATNGPELDMDTRCPECSEEGKFGLNLSIILNNFVAGDYDKTLNVNDLKIKFKPLSYRELSLSSIRQFEIQKMFIGVNELPEGPERDKKTGEILKVISDSTVEVLSHTIEFIATPEVVVTENQYILDFLFNTDKKTFEAIKDYSIKLRETTQTKPLHMTCQSCSHEYDQPFTLNVSDFFG
jgi:hypothetical protein